MKHLLLLSLIHVYYVLASPYNNDAFKNSEHRSRYCNKSAVCQPLNYTLCLGVKLPYTTTSMALVPDLESQDEIQEKLHRWKDGLMHIPKCWAVIQPFLCSLYMPKCENGSVVLPSKEMCDVVKYPCRILMTDNMWPKEFNCTMYNRENCKNNMREMKFNTTGRCKSPLVQAEHDSSFYEGIEGCGIQCHDPFFSEDERQEIRTIVFGGSLLSFLCCFFTVLTFVIDWNSTNKYPAALAVFYINFCFLLVSIGYMYQFLPFASEHMICRKDGTLRTSEPSIRENLSCVTNFVFVYYFFIAGIVWFVIFAYAWYLSLKRIEKGKIKYRKDKRGPYYHLIAWSFPLVLTIMIMAFGEIDGDSLLGVCYVGIVNKQFRLIFLLGPLLCSAIGLILFAKGIVTLVCLKITGKEHITSQANTKICESIARILIFSTFYALFGFVTFMYNVYDYQHYHLWKQSFKRLIICQLGVVGDTEVDRCRMEHKPSVLMVQLQLIALFGTHINMATWVFTKSTIRTWSKFIKKLMNKQVEEQVNVKRHKLIARAYAKRKLLNSHGLNSDGRLSISISNSQDPVGLNLELNSLPTNNLSSTWAKVLPKLIIRRGALAGISRPNSSQRNSSEISYSVKSLHVESRRHSQESTVSLQTLTVRNKISKNRNTRKGRSYKRKSRNRRGSNTSQCSNLETEVLKILKIGNFNKPSVCTPNMDRRLGICGIEKSNLKLLGVGEKLLEQYQVYDEPSFSENSLDVSKQLKSDDSDSENDSESCQEEDPLNAIEKA